MLEITSRVRACARGERKNCAGDVYNAEKNFSLFLNFFSIFLIFLKKVREMTHFLQWFRKWQGSRHKPFCPSKMGSLQESHLCSPLVCRA